MRQTMTLHLREVALSHIVTLVTAKVAILDNRHVLALEVLQPRPPVARDVLTKLARLRLLLVPLEHVLVIVPDRLLANGTCIAGLRFLRRLPCVRRKEVILHV